MVATGCWNIVVPSPKGQTLPQACPLVKAETGKTPTRISGFSEVRLYQALEAEISGGKTTICQRGDCPGRGLSRLLEVDRRGEGSVIEAEEIEAGLDPGVMKFAQEVGLERVQRRGVLLRQLAADEETQ